MVIQSLVRDLPYATEDTQDPKGVLSLVERVYRHVKHGILTHHYAPGYQVLEPELAKILGVSRTPVREALIRLENEGLIELIPRRGMRVIKVLAEDLADLCPILIQLEVTAFQRLQRQVVALDAALAMPPQQHSNLDANLSRYQQEVRVYRALVNLCDHPHLALLSSTLYDQTDRAMQQVFCLRKRGLPDMPTNPIPPQQLVARLMTEEWAQTLDSHKLYREKQLSWLVDQMRSHL